MKLFWPHVWRTIIETSLAKSSRFETRKSSIYR